MENNRKPPVLGDPYPPFSAGLVGPVETDLYNAMLKAQEASGAASTAQGAAEDAQEAAETAQGKAEDAQEAAETAQGKAEDAQEAAESSAASVADSAAQIATNTTDITGLKADVKSKVDAFYITGNLLFNSVFHKNEMYYGTAVASSSYSYFEIDITNGTTYYCSSDLRYLYNDNKQSIISSYVNHTYTATYTGKLYATFYNASTDWIFSTNSDFSDIAGFKTFPFRKSIIKQTTGTDEKFPMSQKAVTDSISAVDAAIAETNTHVQMYEMDIEWLRKVDGKAWGTTTERSYSGFTSTGYLPCKPGDTVSYTLALPEGYSVFARFNANKQCLGYVEGTGNANLITNTYTFVEGDAYFMLSTVKRDSFASYGYKTYYNGGNIQKWINDSLAEFGQIPDYWRDTMATICNTLNQNAIAMADHGDTFAFITDQHWSSNAKNSPELIKYIADRVSLTMVVSGGDVVNSKNATKLGAVNEIVNYYKEFRRSDLRLFSTIGNHDLNTVGNADTSTYLTKDELYPVMLKDAEEFTTTAGSNVTVFDNESQMIRYIQFYYTSDSGYVEDVNTALMDALDDAPAGWTVVLFSHAYWTTGETVPTASTTYANHILAKMDEMQATVACWIVGHIHNDLVEELTSTGGKPLNVISTSTDSYRQMQNADSPPYTMTKGTTTEQCFDIVQIDTSAKTVKMTRVGVGSNRTYSYAEE